MKILNDKKIVVAIRLLAKKYSLNLVGLFGSYARGDAHAASDIDIAYLAKRPLGLEQEVRLSYDLSRIFKSDAIDIVDISKAQTLLLYAIFRDGQKLYEKNKLLFANYYAYAFKKFVETKKLYQLQYDRLKEYYSFHCFGKISKILKNTPS